MIFHYQIMGWKVYNKFHMIFITKSWDEKFMINIKYKIAMFWTPCPKVTNVIAYVQA
jgi:hypothetical protein